MVFVAVNVFIKLDAIVTINLHNVCGHLGHVFDRLTFKGQSINEVIDARAPFQIIDVIVRSIVIHVINLWQFVWIWYPLLRNDSMLASEQIAKGDSDVVIAESFDHFALVGYPSDYVRIVDVDLVVFVEYTDFPVVFTLHFLE